MLEPDVQLVSVDDHVVEHATVWSDRLPAKFRDVGPRVVEEPPDRQVWMFEGRRYECLGLDASVGRSVEEFRLEPRRFTDMHDGVYIPSARVADMNEDGIAVQSLFPSFPRFCGQTFLEADDHELGLACIRAYNDFLIEEWVDAHPGRFMAFSILPLWDPQLAADEIRRTKERGAHGITFPENPVPLGLPSFYQPHWDPVWAAAAEADMPLCMHFGSSSQIQQPSPESPFMLPITLAALSSMSTAADLIFSPVFRKHPNLKVVLSEGGIGWVPYLLERLDFSFGRHRYFDDIDYSRQPSEIFRDHIWVCFITDENGLRLRDVVGVDKIMWECDYPHSDSLWPNSRKVLESSLLDVPANESRKIAEENARALFNLPRTK
jgi:predicted TIM-barrel fold metal-dependent hydrolase